MSLLDAAECVRQMIRDAAKAYSLRPGAEQWLASHVQITPRMEELLRETGMMPCRLMDGMEIHRGNDFMVWNPENPADRDVVGRLPRARAA